MKKYIPNIVAGLVSIPGIIYIGQTSNDWQASLLSLSVCLATQVILAVVAALFPNA